MALRRTALLPGLAGALALACGGPAQLRYEEELARTPAPAAHAVHSERLAELMRGLERLRSERLPPAMDAEMEREARAQLVAGVAVAMAASAAGIPDAADVAALDAHEREEFRSRAENLQRRSERLARRARQRPPPDLGDAVAAVDATCDGCHRRFLIGGLREEE